MKYQHPNLDSLFTMPFYSNIATCEYHMIYVGRGTDKGEDRDGERGSEKGEERDGERGSEKGEREREVKERGTDKGQR